MPTYNNSSPTPTCSVQWAQGYTLLDLSQFTSFSTGQDLQILMRNTLPNTTTAAQPSAFQCSGLAIPFYTSEYTNVSGAGAGLMGPYAPLVSYPVITSLATTAATPSLPPTSGCGVLPTTAPVLTTAGAAVSYPSSIVQWPTTWPAATASTAKLYCKPPANQPTTPTINFVGSLVQVEDYSVCGTPGACNYINPLSTQTDAFPTATPPPLTATIVGTGFGYLPTILPYATQSSPYLEIIDTAGITTNWDTGTGSGGASCQMYIANWTDTSISLVVNAPINASNMYLAVPPNPYLSPLTDFSPLTLFKNSYNTWICPVAKGDTLTFKVTNPQHPGSGSFSDAVCVGTPGTPATCSP